jgi:hypothetical protein
MNQHLSDLTSDLTLDQIDEILNDEIHDGTEVRI